MARKLELDYIAMGDRIKERRQALELTQGTLARQTGVTTSFIGHIERGEKLPSVETMARLSLALDGIPGLAYTGIEGALYGADMPVIQRY